MARTKSTRARLVDRAARGGHEVPSRRRARRQEAAEEQVAAPESAAPEAGAPTMAIGGVQISGLQLDNMEDTVRTVVTYVQQNPLAAAAVALGAGVVLTNMYFERQSPDTRASRRRSR